MRSRREHCKKFRMMMIRICVCVCVRVVSIDGKKFECLSKGTEKKRRETKSLIFFTPRIHRFRFFDSIFVIYESIFKGMGAAAVVVVVAAATDEQPTLPFSDSICGLRLDRNNSAFSFLFVFQSQEMR